MFQILKKLECVQEHMKKDTNVHRMDVVFAISDWVYVKLCPHRQTSLSGTSYQKMGKWYYGPYQITEFIDSIAMDHDAASVKKNGILDESYLT